MADLVSTFHLTRVDHKNKRDIRLNKDLKLNQAGSILPLLSQIVILLIEILYIFYLPPPPYPPDTNQFEKN
jgi:hypothetical protein